MIGALEKHDENVFLLSLSQSVCRRTYVRVCVLDFRNGFSALKRGNVDRIKEIRQVDALSIDRICGSWLELGTH